MLTILKKNNALMEIQCDYDIALEINEFFSHFAPNYKFHPLYKQRRWNGKIYLFNLKARTLPMGLITEVFRFCSERKYKMNLSDEMKESFGSEYSLEEFGSEIKEFPIAAAGEPINWRDYQLLGVYEGIKGKRRILISPTASGKSLAIYGLVRLVQKRISGKILIVVPSTVLVEQLYNDFTDYATLDDEWECSVECGRLHSGHKYQPHKQITISTWQTLQNWDSEAFCDFECLCIDETHLANAKELTNICNACVNAEWRFGFTGSFPKDRLVQLNILGSFGPMKVLQTSRKAIDEGYISDLEINCMVLRWDDASSKTVRKKKYAEEIEYICAMKARNDFICNLAAACKGNTLILTARVESHGKVIYNRLKEMFPDREVYYIFGEVDVQERERIRQHLETIDNAIVIGNYQILSTGWSVKNIHNGIFAFPSKGFVRVVQSIGRGLRLNTNKERFNLYDIADCFDEKNTTWNHFLSRMEIYSEQEFSYKIKEVEIRDA